MLMEESKMKKKKVLFISSTGGHLEELTQLKELFDKYDYYIVTERTKSNMTSLQYGLLIWKTLQSL